MAPAPPIRVYKAEESFESRRAKLAEDAKIDAKSRRAILDFVDHLGAQGLTAHRQNFYLCTLRPPATAPAGSSSSSPNRASTSGSRVLRASFRLVSSEIVALA